MDLMQKDDDAEESSPDVGGDECVEIAHDIIDALKSEDAEALSAALKQFIHYEGGGDEGEDESSSSPSKGHGLLIALGSPKKG